MSAPLAPKFVVIDDFLPAEILKALEEHVSADPLAMELMDLGGVPGDGSYSAGRKLWVHRDALGPVEQSFSKAVLDRFDRICAGTGITPFQVARVETEVCAQRPGSFFAKHIDTDTQEPSRDLATDRIISSVFYFPREPLAFTGGELTLYDFTGRAPVATVQPRRNRLVAFPSFACHEVTKLDAASDDFENARWSINCWLHRARVSEQPSKAV